MEKELSNIVSAVGNYDQIPTSITSVASVVTMIDGLSISKVADKRVWADGLLTYTVTITNNTVKEYSSPVVQDTLDILLIDFVDSSVTIDGVTSSAYTYSSDTGLLTINLDKIDASSSKVITFQVKKK